MSDFLSAWQDDNLGKRNNLTHTYFYAHCDINSCRDYRTKICKADLLKFDNS